jgi:hypothetical protein
MRVGETRRSLAALAIVRVHVSLACGGAMSLEDDEAAESKTSTV